MSDDLNAAIRIGCIAADIHLTCSYPECTCKTIPNAIKAAIQEWKKRGAAAHLGKQGGTTRAGKLSSERRSEIARQAAMKRWSG
jgi:uncharacterized protein (DUF362 family)